MSCPYTSPTRLRGVEGIVLGYVSNHCARLSENDCGLVRQNANLARKGCSTVVAMTLSWRTKRSLGLLIGLALLSVGSAGGANTSSGEASTEQMARAQAVRLAPHGATVTSVDCKEKDVGFSSRFRCTAHWTQ